MSDVDELFILVLVSFAFSIIIAVGALGGFSSPEPVVESSEVSTCEINISVPDEGEYRVRSARDSAHIPPRSELSGLGGDTTILFADPGDIVTVRRHPSGSVVWVKSVRSDCTLQREVGDV